MLSLALCSVACVSIVDRSSSNLFVLIFSSPSCYTVGLLLIATGLYYYKYRTIMFVDFYKWLQPSKKGAGAIIPTTSDPQKASDPGTTVQGP